MGRFEKRRKRGSKKLLIAEIEMYVCMFKLNYNATTTMPLSNFIESSM